MLQDRCLKTAILGLLLLIPVGTLLPRPPDVTLHGELDRESFWVLKTHCEPVFNMVVMGDSRVYRGIAPSVMEEQLSGRLRVLNFGYSSGGLNPTMYRHAERKLDRRHNDQSIILGLTPHALTPNAAANTHFIQEAARPRDYIIQRRQGMPRLVRELRNFFRPSSPENLVRTLRGTTLRLSLQDELPPGTFREYHHGGWVAAWKAPPDPTAALVEDQRLYENNQVSSALVGELAAQVRQWVESGITVYAFRMPSSPKMVDLENKLSGFDEPAIVSMLEEAGAVCFTFSLTAYKSYDGSHLDKHSAIRLSQDLAERIATYRASQPGTQKP